MINYLSQHPNDTVKKLVKVFAENGGIPTDDEVNIIKQQLGRSNVEAAIKIFQRKAK